MAKNKAEDQFSVRLVCRNCRSDVPHIVEDFASGELVCGDCGLVLGDRIIDVRSEWRTFADSEGDDPSRVGNSANPLLDGDQLDTMIGRGNGDTALSKGLNRIQARTKEHKHEQTLLHAYREISSLCDSFKLPKSIVDTAKQLYKKTLSMNLQNGRSADAIMAVCVVLACRQGGAPRTIKEICAVTRVSVREISRTLKLLKTKLIPESSLTSSKDLIERFCSNLRLDAEVWRISRDMNELAMDVPNISGKNPMSIAGACIYMASHLVNKGRSPRAISEVSGIGEATVRSTYKILYASRKLLLTPEIMNRNPNAQEKNLIVP
ncbi:transcription initiation factor IIB [Coemansia sp. RSA 989]|nr:cyclin-like protein [Coemansia mojavensis]KAJ1741228.1 transcription initiation factor IIB [Coemansia sp. RSA 1086]KAJ1751524.1 transcription initiation factor IIB [Coemansia sp. RSA 1821]KAJ1866204.1 transcription initiation factor IIB [Coemansia sp. RSA 989]KAJ1873433.1 transcription initiation factor IIB [Coemansia sp. RSA 990]KAJ2633312.1 transcription initiation factor IIB [Coemansia sp. RSA 1290]KAJ2647965.1 transcription initiation factor IIB [Coemansia sp. RSA 1250]KAJ2670023.1 tr